jgi:deoxyhypusine synthase
MGHQGKFCKKKVAPLDPAKITSVDDLCRALAGCGFQGRKLSRAAEVWEAMCRDKECLKIMTLSGAMVPAGMGEVIMRLIEARAIDVLISTGANMTHDFVNAVVDQGHYQGSEHEDDDALRAERTNRIFDVYIPEVHYERGEDWLLGLLRREGITERSFSTAEFTRFLGERLERRSILSVAASHGVPVFVPAISDSELGIALAIYRERDGISVRFDELGDIPLLGRMIEENPRCGTVVVGGGVPRNWAQQVFPFLDIVHRESLADNPYPGFSYGVRISTDRPEFGGLSGCTFEEAKSWGKYSSGARFESVVCDATIALPILAAALLARLGARPA